jgi:hypothetical protein
MGRPISSQIGGREGIVSAKLTQAMLHHRSDADAPPGYEVDR